MLNQLKFICTIFAICMANLLVAQEITIPGTFSGSFQFNGNFFSENDSIGATGNPQYDHQLYGAEGWLGLNYNYMGFDVGVRFDLYNNSNLINPQDSYTDQGLGRWYIKKKIKKFHLSAGYLYDQIGSGIIFRAYEVRPLAIDNALYGFRGIYDINENWKFKGFTGKQKFRFDSYPTIIKGASIEGFIAPKDREEGEAERKVNWSLAPGAGIVNKTVADDEMNRIVNTISTYAVQDSIGARFNTVAVTLYNTLTVGRFNWYVEGAYKTYDNYFDPFLAKNSDAGGPPSFGRLDLQEGTTIYTSLSWAKKGFGISIEGKRTENFTFRTNPFVQLNQGTINFLPPMARENAYRMTTFYQAATQELGEQAFQIDLKYAPSRKLNFNVNLANITNLDDELLYRELYTEINFKYKRKWQITGGVQFQQYNQEIYEVKPKVPMVETIVPNVDFLYKFNRKKALRIEAQYLHTEQDRGSWAYGLAEFTIAPKWAFVLSDMYNVSPKNGIKARHYPRADIFYTNGPNRFSLSAVQQVAGVVCTGGICRFEPAFSGVKFTVNSVF